MASAIPRQNCWGPDYSLPDRNEKWLVSNKASSKLSTVVASTKLEFWDTWVFWSFHLSCHEILKCSRAFSSSPLSTPSRSLHSCSLYGRCHLPIIFAAIFRIILTSFQHSPCEQMTLCDFHKLQRIAEVHKFFVRALLPHNQNRATNLKSEPILHCKIWATMFHIDSNTTITKTDG